MTSDQRALMGAFDPTEVRNAEDMAAHRADEFLALALLSHQVKAQGGMAVLPGVCTYCQAQCHPRAVYCDTDCRADHEAELRTLARQGRSA